VVSQRVLRNGQALNRIDQPGTPEEAWESWLELRHLPAAGHQAWRSVAIVAAHPDDEVLGVGGTMALLAAAGTRLRLIAVTDGEASHPAADPAVTALTRIGESADALRALGARDIEVIRLRFPDTGLAAREDELAARLGELCAGFGACLAPWQADAHADHEAAGRAARRAAWQLPGIEILSYPIWMWHWARPADPRVPWTRACRIPLPPDVSARKRSAIGAFASQLAGRGPLGPVLPPPIVAHFTSGQEVLLR
jgi:LmbE family N-acetylglucosaminyl deacetylase